VTNDTPGSFAAGQHPTRRCVGCDPFYLDSPIVKQVEDGGQSVRPVLVDEQDMMSLHLFTGKIGEGAAHCGSDSTSDGDPVETRRHRRTSAGGGAPLPGMRRTSTNSRPNACTLVRIPCNAAWSGTTPLKTVSAGWSIAVIPSNSASASAGISPRT
jgi:hypothetical protein